MAFSLSDVTPFLPLAGNALSVLANAIESAIASHRAGDPDAALAALEAAAVEVAPVIASLADQVAAQRKAMDAAEDEKFPPNPGLAATTAAIHAHFAAIAQPLTAPVDETVSGR